MKNWREIFNIQPKLRTEAIQIYSHVGHFGYAITDLKEFKKFGFTVPVMGDNIETFNLATFSEDGVMGWLKKNNQFLSEDIFILCNKCKHSGYIFLRLCYHVDTEENAIYLAKHLDQSVIFDCEKSKSLLLQF